MRWYTGILESLAVMAVFSSVILCCAYLLIGSRQDVNDATRVRCDELCGPRVVFELSPEGLLSCSCLGVEP